MVERVVCLFQTGMFPEKYGQAIELWSECRPMKSRQIIIGAVTWLSLLVGSAVAIQSHFQSRSKGFIDVVSGISRWISGAPKEFDAVSAVPILLAPGDPVFLKTADGSYRQVGRVRNHFSPKANRPDSTLVEQMAEVYTQKASVVLYDDAVHQMHPAGFRLEHHTTPTSLDWVVTTIFTPERQQEIAQIIARDWEKHRTQIVAKLQPVMETSISRAISAIDAELPSVMNAHRGDFAKLADRYQADIVRKQLVPLVRTEILPIVQEEVRPLAMSLGEDLWDRVSLWSFTWRYIYDVSPLPEKNAVGQEFARFMKDEVTPALEMRSEEFVAVTERIMRRISRNEKVRAVLRENLRNVATDGELQTIVWQVVQEAVVNNQTLRSSLSEYWASEEVQQAMSLASTSFEPTARSVGDAIFGGRETGVTPEFSRVLRAQILMKDRRWLVIVPPSADTRLKPEPVAGSLVMFPSIAPMPFPIEFEGTEQSPLTPEG